MTNHSRLSPSSRHRWQLCPGSVREEAKYPDDTSSKSSIDGTHSHTLLEKCLDSGGDAASYIGGTLTDHDGSFVVDAARAERVQVALGYISERTKDEQEFEVIAETQVNPEGCTGRIDLSGTVDVQIHFNEGWVVEVIDYKDGMSPVEAKNNPQLEQYALGVIDDYTLHQDCVIRMTIIQPKLRLKGLSAITSHDMTVKELREVVAPKLVQEAAATDRKDAPLVAGDVQCKYCKHKACPVRVNKTMESVGMMFQPVNTMNNYANASQSPKPINPYAQMFQPINAVKVSTVTENALKTLTEIDERIGETLTYDPYADDEPMMPWGELPEKVVDTITTVAQQSANKDPTTMTNEQLVELLQAAPLMRQMLDAAEEEALNRSKAGQVVPGYKLVHGPGSRAWIHEGDNMAQKLIKMGIPKTAVYVTKLVSPAQAEKLQWEKRDGNKVQLTDKQLKRMETEYVKRSKGKLTLVPESDRRPSATPDAAPLFSPVAQELPSWLL